MFEAFHTQLYLTTLQKIWPLVMSLCLHFCITAFSINAYIAVW